MSWSIAEVARMSGVTARTLRHYDHVGLLRPESTAAGGRRYYGREELHRLQRILLLRELGLTLDAVGQVLSAESDGGPTAPAALGALRRHLDRLVRERERFTRLIDTVRTTIETLERGGEMSPETMFAGFGHNPYEAEARERWGDAAVDASIERMKGWSRADAERVLGGYARVHRGLAELRDAGAAVDDEPVQALIAEHYGVVSLFWTPDAETYRNLGAMYVDDERFRRNIGQGDDALVEFLRDAMAVYAGARLS